MYQVVMPGKLTPTGISGLDNLIGGGFQKGSIIMLAGNPGTGKTVFASKFLSSGLTDFGEPGIYVSFGENKETLVGNMDKQCGPGIGKSLRNDKIKFLEYTVMTDVGLEAILKTILDEVVKLGAKRLVIDSYSAMAPLFEKGAIRTVLHSVLGEVVREAGCTTLMICEVPRGDLNLGTGVEEFVADGIILLSTKEIDGRPIRELEILKMRGAKLEKTKCVFSMQGGMEVFEPIIVQQPKTPVKFKTIADSKLRYSTGLAELDTILSGGYVKGDVVLMEVGENVTAPEYSMFTLPCIKNFLGHGKAVIDIPSVGVGMTLPESLVRYGGLTADQLDKLLTLCIPKEHLSVIPKNSKVWTFDSSDVAGSLANFPAMINNLTQKFRQTSLYMEGVDTLFSSFGPENVVKLLNATITASRNHGNLNLMILRPGIPAPALYDMCKSIADVHMKLIKREGTLLFLGLKPWTGIYAVQTDSTMGYPWPRLAPLV
jgi:KaiC/GvpD/RAD55 family RecA-like ATPase